MERPCNLLHQALPLINLPGNQSRQFREFLKMRGQCFNRERLQCDAGSQSDEIEYQQLCGEALGGRDCELASSPGWQTDLRFTGHAGVLDIRNRYGAMTAAVCLAQCGQRI